MSGERISLDDFRNAIEEGEPPQIVMGIWERLCDQAEADGDKDAEEMRTKIWEVLAATSAESAQAEVDRHGGMSREDVVKRLKEMADLPRPKH